MKKNVLGVISFSIGNHVFVVFNGSSNDMLQCC